ncbi:hypothetical protein J6590_025349 [Homalodisca vitripennis]|nr:hypothetical protein J6590_025349 [Homalodisca vitripennis]
MVDLSTICISFQQWKCNEETGKATRHECPLLERCSRAQTVKTLYIATFHLEIVRQVLERNLKTLKGLQKWKEGNFRLETHY